jgi:hypothetical protein
MQNRLDRRYLDCRLMQVAKRTLLPTYRAQHLEHAYAAPARHDLPVPPNSGTTKKETQLWNTYGLDRRDSRYPESGTA